MLRLRGLIQNAVPTAARQYPQHASGARSFVDITQEEWVAADVNVAGQTAVFSDPLTADELEASRNEIASNFGGSSAQALLDDDTFDPNDQIVRMEDVARAQQLSPEVTMRPGLPLLDFALAMAADVSVQASCMEAIRTNPDVYASFSKLAKEHGVDLILTDSTIALPPAARAIEGAPLSHDLSEEDLRSDPNGLTLLFEALQRSCGSAGQVIVQFVQRQTRRLDNLVRKLTGKPPLDENGEEMGEDKEGGLNRGEVLISAAMTAVALIVAVALLRRIPVRL